MSYYWDHREEILAKKKLARQADPEKYRKLSRESYAKRGSGYIPERYWAWKLRKWGLTEYGTHCEICGKEPPIGRKLDIDHNHQTGEFRGFLCRLCNTALGNFQDSPELLRRAAEYLELLDRVERAK